VNRPWVVVMDMPNRFTPNDPSDPLGPAGGTTEPTPPTVVKRFRRERSARARVEMHADMGRLGYRVLFDPNHVAEREILQDLARHRRVEIYRGVLADDPAEGFETR
jgi:hypothetical protein